MRCETVDVRQETGDMRHEAGDMRQETGDRYIVVKKLWMKIFRKIRLSCTIFSWRKYFPIECGRAALKLRGAELWWR